MSDLSRPRTKLDDVFGPRGEDGAYHVDGDKLAAAARATRTNSPDGGHLRAFVERIERMEEEKRALLDDIKEIYSEAKGAGFDPKVIRKLVSLRRQDEGKRREEAEILDLYLTALGMEPL
jgi:uncharacterized protein (UPF0335 family)